MSLPATDNLIHGSNESLTAYSANWTIILNSYQVNTNGGSGNFSGGICTAFWNADVFPNDQSAQCVINAAGAAVNFNGILVRGGGSAGTGYGYSAYASVTSSEYAVFKTVAGAVTTLSGTLSHAFAPSDLLYLSAVGTTITFKQNGTTLYSVTDASLASGSAGLTAYGTNTDVITSWQGGAILENVIAWVT